MKFEKSRPIGILVGNLLVSVIVMGMLLILLAVPGCDEAMNMTETVMGEPDETPEPIMTGEVKQPEPEPVEEVSGEPVEETPPADTTPPTVIEVAWYSDWQMTAMLTPDSTVRPEDTVYTVVKFSEPVVHTVSTDETARPALFAVIDGAEMRYGMVARNVSFKSGEAKPINGDADEYLCKYTIPADVVGTPSLRVGGATADTAGNRVAEATVHTAPFAVTEPESGQVTLVLPPEHIRRRTPVSGVRLATYLFDPSLEFKTEEARMQPATHTALGLAADEISLLPINQRQEAYDNFIRRVDLPHIVEASNKMVAFANATVELAIEYRGNLDGYYDAYDVAIERAFGSDIGNLFPPLDQRYFNANPDHRMYPAGHDQGGSRYWFLLEYARLQMQYPRRSDEPRDRYEIRLVNLFSESAKKGWVLGLDNPWF